MKNLLKSTLQVLFATTLLFLILEAICYFVGMPVGGNSFTEKIILKENLSPKKPKGEYRIFTYGESTMYGAHYGSVSSPARWLDVYLKDFLPEKNIRIVNFGRQGQGSADCYETFKDSLPYKPDLVIFYIGHNSFLASGRKDKVEAKQKSFSYIVHQYLERSRFISAAYRSVLKIQVMLKTEKVKNRTKPSIIEVFPIGIDQKYVTPKNEPFYWENLQFFKTNTLKILNLAEQNHVPALFLKPVSNLKDFSPYYSVHIKKLAANDLMRWETFYEEGKKAQEGNDLIQAMSFYPQAYDIDNTFAELSFRMGQIYFRNQDFKKARELFEEARDNDAMITRATKEVFEFFDELAKTEKMNLIDTEKALTPEVEGGILGEPVIEDNVHLSLKGHSLIGRLIAQEIAERNWIAPKTEWKFERERSFNKISREIGIDDQIKFYAYLELVKYFGSRYDKRLQFAQKALELKPNDPRALRALAWTYWLMEDKEKALETYNKLEEVDSGALKEVFKVQPQMERLSIKINLQRSPKKRGLPEMLPIV